MSTGRRYRSIVRDMSMAVALILIMLTLSSCASIREVYLSRFSALSSSLFDLIDRITDCARQISRDPTLWEDETKRLKGLEKMCRSRLWTPATH